MNKGNDAQVSLHLPEFTCKPSSPCVNMYTRERRVIVYAYMNTHTHLHTQTDTGWFSPSLSVCLSRKQTRKETSFSYLIFLQLFLFSLLFFFSLTPLLHSPPPPFSLRFLSFDFITSLSSFSLPIFTSPFLLSLSPFLL